MPKETLFNFRKWMNFTHLSANDTASPSFSFFLHHQTFLKFLFFKLRILVKENPFWIGIRKTS
jgi:hypothetical protein